MERSSRASPYREHGTYLAFGLRCCGLEQLKRRTLSGVSVPPEPPCLRGLSARGRGDKSGPVLLRLKALLLASGRRRLRWHREEWSRWQQGSGCCWLQADREVSGQRSNRPRGKATHVAADTRVFTSERGFHARRRRGET